PRRAAVAGWHAGCSAQARSAGTYLAYFRHQRFDESPDVVSKLDSALAFQQQALNLRAYRQQILAGNIANADTPHSKARDIDFSAALKNAVAGRSGGDLPGARTSPSHLAGPAGQGPAPSRYRGELQSAVD